MQAYTSQGASFPAWRVDWAYLSASAIRTADQFDPALTRTNDVSLQHFVLMFGNLRAIQM
ncbi:hypothetical protein CO652_28930 [Rhizobium sp. H4]|nr:hypothetical protein CO652_28930 [Rhizobium sp. H4]